MNTGIIIEARLGSYKVQRASEFKLVKECRQISMVEIHIHDMDYRLLQGLSEGDSASIIFGYRDGQQAEFNGEVMLPPASIGSNITRVLVAGREYVYARTRISESYNDESPAAIIKQLSSMAGIDVGVLNVPDEPLEHIVFNTISVWFAFAQIRQVLQRNGHKGDLDYWLYQDKLYWGCVNQPKTTVIGKNAIINHSSAHSSGSVVELPLLPQIDYSELIYIDDERRGIKNSFRINSIAHVFSQSKSRTFVGYNA